MNETITFRIRVPVPGDELIEKEVRLTIAEALLIAVDQAADELFVQGTRGDGDAAKKPVGLIPPWLFGRPIIEINGALKEALGDG